MADEVTYERNEENPDIIVQKIVSSEEISLQALRDELSVLEQYIEPTTEELIALGMNSHPYYESRKRIVYLQQRISELESV